MRRTRKKEKKFFKIPMKVKILFLCGMILLIAGVFFFASQTGKQVLKSGESIYDYMRYKSGLVVEEVTVSGRLRTTMEELNPAIGITPGMPIFDVDLGAMHDRIIRLPWVKSVTIERQLPNRIVIEIIERIPIAVWQNNGRYWPVDETGAIINDNGKPVGSILLVVGGQDALKHTLELVNVLDKFPEVQEKTLSAVRVGNRRWDLVLTDLNDGLVINLPETGIEKALARISEMNVKSQILTKDLRIIDVRQEDRFIVQSKAEFDLKKIKKGKR